MSNPKIEIPAGWQVQGELPGAVPAPGFLFEDLFSISTPNGEVTLDVGWTPPTNPDGAFICRLVADENWDAPIDELTTREFLQVRDWVGASVESMRRIYGNELTSPHAAASGEPTITDVSPFDVNTPKPNVTVDPPAKARRVATEIRPRDVRVSDENNLSP